MATPSNRRNIHGPQAMSAPWNHRSAVLIAALLTALSVWPGPDPARAQTYTFDDAGRLIRVAYAQGNGVQYAYDDADNLTAVTAISLAAAPTNLTVTRVSGTSTQLTWQDNAGNESGYVVMRRLSTNYVWQVVANLGANATGYADSALDPAATYVYRIAATRSTGLSAHSNEASSASNSGVQVTLGAGGSGTSSTIGGDGPVQAGYATVTVDLGQAPYGTAVFSLRQNNAIVSEAGVPASPPTKAARVFIDFRTGVATGSGTIEVNTGFAVVNRGTAIANITYTLRDVSARTLAVGRGTLDSGAHYAKFINQTKDVALDFVLPAEFPVNIRYGTLEFTSDQPLSILALRLTTNQRNETLLTSTPIADLSGSPGSEPLFFPQIADGGGYTTSVVLLNTSSTTESGTIEIYGDGGLPLSVKLTDGNSGSTFPYSIPSGGARLFQTDGSPAAANAGWVRLTPNPGTPSPVGAGLFGYSPAGILLTESGVPSATPTTRARIYVDKSEGHDTGLAIVIPGAESGSVSVGAFRNDGATGVGSSQGPLALPARGHTAKFVGELISGLPSDFTGVLDISSDKPFLALTLRSLYNSRGDFLLTTFPIADLNRPAPSPVVFPQIADGGGFVTQFILLSAGGGVTTTINLFGDDGAPLSVIRKP
jgi:YD repeat-containing protein